MMKPARGTGEAGEVRRTKEGMMACMAASQDQWPMDQRCWRVLVWRIGAWECLRWRGIPAVGARGADAAGGGHPREPVEAIRWPSSVLSSTVPCAQKKTASAGAVLAATRLFAVETRDSRDRGRGEAGQQTPRSQDGLQSAAGACCPGRRTVIQGTSPRRTAPGPLPSLDPGSAVDGCKDRSGSTEFPGHTTEPRAEEGFCRFAKTFFFGFAVSRVKTRRCTR